ncbi:MAG: response regulator [Candidatus Rokubacteria bacterium]|nr:response regulator [Candidatus Rokubacteria bacterium]
MKGAESRGGEAEGGADGAAGMTSPPSPSLGGIRIVVVDDEDDVRELLVDILRSHGAHVESAASARAALLLLRTSRPDVLVTDIAMPKEDGFWLIREVRALSPAEGGRVSVLAVSGHMSAGDRHRLTAAGFDELMEKPVDLQKFCETVSRLGASARITSRWSLE